MTCDGRVTTFTESKRLVIVFVVAATSSVGGRNQKKLAVLYVYQQLGEVVKISSWWASVLGANWPMKMIRPDRGVCRLRRTKWRPSEAPDVGQYVAGHDLIGFSFTLWSLLFWLCGCGFACTGRLDMRMFTFTRSDASECTCVFGSWRRNPQLFPLAAVRRSKLTESRIYRMLDLFFGRKLQDAWRSRSRWRDRRLAHAVRRSDAPTVGRWAFLVTV